MKRNIYLILSLIGLLNTTIIGQFNNSSISTYDKIEDLLNRIQLMYVNKVDVATLENDLVIGMSNQLTPFSAYQKNTITDKLEIKAQHSYESIGISFKFKGDTILVENVIPNSGAENANIISGDRIFQIDEHSVDQMYYYSDVTKHLIGPENTELKAHLMRDNDTIICSIKRTKIKDHNLVLLGDYGSNYSLRTYNSALKYFDAIYPDSVKNSLITEHGIRYMLEQLDPHSTYISLEDIHDMNAPLKGSFTGVGVRFQIVKDTIIIVQAIPGGPSEKVGIMSGDKIVKINDETVGGIGIKNSGVRDRLLGEKGSEVKVHIKRFGVKELLEFNIERDKIPIYSVDASYMVTPKIGYIKLNNFSASSISEIRKAVYQLKSDGMEDIILDLQNNGGGYLMTAVDLADEFLSGNKLVVSTKGRMFIENPYETRSKGLLENGNVVILVNESSASASEIVSGAIQDWDRGLIIGRRTFGKGLVQKPINLMDGTQVRITTSKYYTPTGRCIQKPYEKGSIAYRKEKYDRYSSGESFHRDSIKFNEDEIFSTKLKNRKVYGGGGIMPDYFVPLDTTGTSDYYSSLIRKGIMNQFSLIWVNKNREKLENKYTSFKKFKSDFNIEKVTKELIEYAEEEGLEFDEENYEKAENTIKIRLKANIAQNLYDYTKFYEIINELNNTLKKSIELLEDGEAFKKLVKN